MAKKMVVTSAGSKPAQPVINASTEVVEDAPDVVLPSKGKMILSLILHYGIFPIFRVLQVLSLIIPIISLYVIDKLAYVLYNIISLINTGIFFISSYSRLFKLYLLKPLLSGDFIYSNSNAVQREG